MDYINIIILSIFVNNVILFQFQGFSPTIDLSGKVSTSLKIGLGFIVLMILSNIFTFIINKYILTPFKLEFLLIITFIVVIVALALLLKIIIKNISQNIYNNYSAYLPIIATNCAVLGVAILAIQKHFDLIHSIVYSSASAIGYSLVIVLIEGIREQIEIIGVPKAMKGLPIILITIGLLSLAFMGFAGLAK